jgi:hypothetical protein
VRIRASTTLASLIALAACATRPAPQPADAVSAAIAAPAAATPSATSASAPGAQSGDALADLHNYARSRGYKSVKRNGKQVWCRPEPTLGSHFETRSCVTDSVMADLKRKAEENQQEMIHEYRPNCVGPRCSS